VLTSALGNAATTYAIGRRAEAFAKMGAAPADSLVDAFRAFTGVDERRVWEWSVTATKEALGTMARVTAKVKAMNPFARVEVPDVDVGEDAADEGDDTAAEPAAPKRQPRAAAKATTKEKPARKATEKRTAAKAAAKKAGKAPPAAKKRSTAKTARKPAAKRRGDGDASS
jgi:hypothetical protein